MLQQKQLGAKLPVNSSATAGMTTQQQQQLSVLLKQQELIKQQQQATLSLGNQVAQTTSPKKGGTAPQARRPLVSLLAKKSDKEDGQPPLKSSKAHEK